jgi:hypothetical protein
MCLFASRKEPTLSDYFKALFHGITQKCIKEEEKLNVVVSSKITEEDGDLAVSISTTNYKKFGRDKTIDISRNGSVLVHKINDMANKPFYMTVFIPSVAFLRVEDFLFFVLMSTYNQCHDFSLVAYVRECMQNGTIKYTIDQHQTALKNTLARIEIQPSNEPMIKTIKIVLSAFILRETIKAMSTVVQQHIHT